MPKEKARILRWRGTLGDDDRTRRWMVAAILVVTGIALTFTQLGFIGVSLPDGTEGYAVVLLQVVALGALLLGTFAGTMIGLLVGGMLYMHAQYLPLDQYEMTFVTSFTSIILLGGAGFLLGILFALALRKNPPPVKRAIRIVLVCLLVSALYSTYFTMSVLIWFAADIYARFGDALTESYVSKRAWDVASELGNVTLQAGIDAVLMVFLCCVGDYVARRVRERRGSRGLRAVFGTWLSVAVALTFMVTAAMSFTAITVTEFRNAEDLMKSEVNYLCIQFETHEKGIQAINEMLETGILDLAELDEDLSERLSRSFSDENILEGYTIEDDGLLIVAYMDYVCLSNDETYRVEGTIEEVLGDSMCSAIDRSLETGEVQRFILSGPFMMNNQPIDEIFENARAEIAFLYARSITVIDRKGQQFEETIVMAQPSAMVFRDRPAVMAWTTLSSLALLLAVFIIVFRLLNVVVARRIDEENASLALITAGDLSVRAEAGGTLEFDSLSEGINTTVRALRGWIAEAETRMDAELATARAIQESALPRTFPPYPDILKFDLYASMNAAREVGGDFYDFFLLGDCDQSLGKLAFVVADVSGKGVPAALFMMTAKTLIRDYLESGMELGEALTEVNRKLCEGNDEAVFVTAWVGVLDYGTGHLEYVNAGHNPPLIWQRKGGWSWMRQKSGPMLGLFDVFYKARTVDCTAGDTLLLYTDGVTEAFDVNGQLYGEARLMEVAEEGYRLHPRELLESVRRSVALWSEGAEQSDDITILALEVGVPPEVTATIKVPAQLDQLQRVNDFLHAELDRRLCPKRVQNQLDIAVEELFVNVCNYAYRGTELGRRGEGYARIQRTYTVDPSSITVEIIDEGVPFDPLAKPDAVTPTDIADVPIGGLGILMAKKSVNEISYERTDGCNIVTIVKKW